MPSSINVVLTYQRKLRSQKAEYKIDAYKDIIEAQAAFKLVVRNAMLGPLAPFYSGMTPKPKYSQSVSSNAYDFFEVGVPDPLMSVRLLVATYQSSKKTGGNAVGGPASPSGPGPIGPVGPVGSSGKKGVSAAAVTPSPAGATVQVDPNGNPFVLLPDGTKIPLNTACVPGSNEDEDEDE